MQFDTNISSTLSLEAVAQQFEHWRATRIKRGRIPNELWVLAASLLSKYNHNKIASALKMNHTQLKAGALPFLPSKQQPSTTFVECALPTSVMPTTGSCFVEFTRKNGSTVKISGLTDIQLQPLFSALLRGE